MGQQIERVARALERLYLDNALDKQSSKALEVPNVKAAIEQGLGERSSADELLLVTILVDDSMSVASCIGDIRRGHNAILDALRDTPTTAEVRVHSRALNRGILSPYRPITQAMELTATNFGDRQLSPHGTPLFLQSLIALGTALVKAQEEEDHGTKVRTFTLVITDAEDNRSKDITAGHVRFIVTDMTEFATNHIVAGMGVGERPGINFYNIFSDMGIPRRWVFTSATSSDDIRKEFDRVAKDLALAATSETEFLQLAAGSSDA